MKNIKIVFTVLLISLITSCSSIPKPDKKLIEAVIKGHYGDLVTVSELKYNFSKETTKDTIHFITATFNADVYFDQTFIYYPDDGDQSKMRFLTQGTTKVIYNGIIQFLNRKGYWELVDIKIPYDYK